MFVLLMAILGTAAHAVQWKEIYTKDGVTVSKADVDDTKLVAFRGETTMDAPIGKVLGVLVDHDHVGEWVARLVTARVLEAKGPFDYTMYQSFEVPVFSDRDYVFRAVTTRDADTGVVTQALESTTHPDAPETIGVRADLVRSRYRLTPQTDGRTRVEVEILTDPRGTIPSWIVNLIQRSWPLDTLTGIRAQLGDAWVQEIAQPE